MAVSTAKLVEELALALNENPRTVTAESVLAELPGWDSVGQLSVIACIDAAVGKTANVDGLRGCRTIGDIVAMFPEDVEP